MGISVENDGNAVQCRSRFGIFAVVLCDEKEVVRGKVRVGYKFLVCASRKLDLYVQSMTVITQFLRLSVST